MKLKAGDVIKIYRSSFGGYYHFGIYTGKEEVIHYVETYNGFSKGIIKKTSLEEFIDNSDISNLEIVIYPNHRSGRTTSVSAEIFTTAVNGKMVNGSIIAGCLEWLCSQFNEYIIYSNKETLERAKSKIGESSYNLLFNNCESFCTWCKTNVRRSEQVEDAFREAIDEKIYDDGFLGHINTDGPVELPVERKMKRIIKNKILDLFF